MFRLYVALGRSQYCLYINFDISYICVHVHLLCPAPNRCGSVAEWLGRWTCDQQVASSNPGLPAIECNPGQVVNGDALRLGR